MYLIHCLDGFSALQCGKGLWATSFSGTIVHDADGWCHALNEDGVITDVEAVVIHLIHIYSAHTVYWFHKLGLHIPGNVAAIKKSKAA